VFGRARTARADEPAASDEPAQWRDELNDARRTLRAALYSKFDADEGEQTRIADILRRAAAEIIGRKSKS
jgi:hypothetical protein